jgi:anti-sigma factor RsiW
MAPPKPDELACAQVQDLLERHLDGELTPEFATRVEGHLARCEACSSDHELATEIREELGRMPQFDAPETIMTAARLQSSDATPPPPSSRTRRPVLQRPAIAALAMAAVAALGVAAVLLLPGTTRPPADDAGTIDQASTEAMLAFALIADATRRAEDELMEGVLKERVLGTAVRGLSRTLQITGGRGLQPQPSPIQEPTPKQGGLT